MKKIMLDPGHGGNDSGAIGTHFNEKSYNLLIAKEVYKKLQNYNCNAFLTRENDTFISLNDRCKKSNDLKCDVFVSIHCNSASVKATGFETFSYNGNSTLQNRLHSEIVKVLPLKDRGKKVEKFYVLKHTKAKAVLLELGFINNPSDSKILNEKINEIVGAITRSLVVELGITPKTNDLCQCICSCK